MLSIHPEDFAIIIEGGYYFMTKNTRPLLHFVQGLQAYPFSQFDLYYNRPDLVLKALGSTNQKLINAYYRAYQKRLRRLGIEEGSTLAKLSMPKVEVLNEQLPLATDQPEINLRLLMNSPTQELAKLEVKVNAVPLGGNNQGIALSGKLVEKELSIPLSVGKNHIEIAVWNNSGVKSLIQVVDINYDSEGKKPKLFLLGIGVGDYPESDKDLTAPTKDVATLVSYYQEGHRKYAKVEVEQILNQEATKAGILEASKFLRQATVNDDVLIFLAGHGLLDADHDFYFACHDVDFLNPKGNGLSYEELQGLFEGVKARNRLMMIDACHSGELDKELLAYEKAQRTEVEEVEFRSQDDQTYNHTNDNGLGLRNSFELMRTLFADLRENTGVTVIAAASGTELAREDAEAGFFTRAFIQGLQSKIADLNQDGKIRLSELRAYVYEQVSKQTGGRQNPTARQENLINDFVLW